MIREGGPMIQLRSAWLAGVAASLLAAGMADAAPPTPPAGSHSGHVLDGQIRQEFCMRPPNKAPYCSEAPKMLIFTAANGGDGLVNLVGTICDQSNICRSFAGDYKGTLRGRHLRIAKSPVGLMDLTAVADATRAAGNSPAAGCTQVYGDWFSMHGSPDHATAIMWTGQFGGIEVSGNRTKYRSSANPECDFEVEGLVGWAFTPPD
jgi:hypothetical protein